MKKLVILLSCILVLSCNNSSNELNGEYITVSIKPQKYILGQIAGDRFKINVLVPDGSGPETYEPTARQMQELRHSKAYLSMGLMDFEKSIGPKLHDLYPDLDVVITSNNINFLTGHNHEHHNSEVESDKHDHDHDHDAIEAIDPHIWLSLKAVKIQSDNILNYLVNKFPDDSTIFVRNHNRFVNRLDSLDNILKEKFAKGAYSFIIYHPSLSYYAGDYGIEQIPIELEGKEPSPAYLKSLIDVARERQLTTVFYSEQFDKKSAVTLADQLGISVTPFDPLAENVEENIILISNHIIESHHKVGAE